MEMIHVLYHVLYAGVRYLVIIKHTNSIHFFQRIQLILLLKIPLINILNAGITTHQSFYIYLNSKYNFIKCRIDAKMIPGNTVQTFKTDVLRVERLLCKIRSKLWPIVFYAILFIFGDNVNHFNENNEVSSSEQLHTNSENTVKG